MNFVRRKLSLLSLFIRHKFFTQTNLKRASIFVFLFSIFSLFFYALPALAQDSGTIRDGLMAWISEVFLGLGQFFMKFTIFALKFFIEIAKYNDYIDAPTVVVGWVMVRDVANMFFVVVLLAIAVGTILGIEQYAWNKTLVKLILAAVFINFSNMICGLIIDVAHVFTITFVSAIAATAGGNLLAMFKLEEVYKIVVGKPPAGSGIGLDVLIGSFAAFMFSFMVFLMILAYLVIMLVRMVVLWVLIILSPIAFITSVLPQTESYGKEWWKEFFNYVLTAPIIVFFLWLAFATMGAGNVMNDLGMSMGEDTLREVAFDQADTAPQSLSVSAVTTWTNLASLLIPLFFLYVGMDRVQKLGVAGSGLLNKAWDVGKKVAIGASGVGLATKLGKGAMSLTGKGIKGATKGILYKAPLVGGKAWERRGKLAWRAAKRWGRGMDDEPKTKVGAAVKKLLSPAQAVSKWFAYRGALQEKELKVSQIVDEEQGKLMGKQVTSSEHGARARDLKGRIAAYEERSQEREKKESDKSKVDEQSKMRYQHRYISRINPETGKREPYKLAVWLGLTRGEVRSEQGTMAEDIARHRKGAVYQGDRKKEMDAEADSKVEQEGLTELTRIEEAKERLAESEMSQPEIDLAAEIKADGVEIAMDKTNLDAAVERRTGARIKQRRFDKKAETITTQRANLEAQWDDYNNNPIVVRAREEDEDVLAAATAKGNIFADLQKLNAEKNELDKKKLGLGGLTSEEQTRYNEIEAEVKAKDLEMSAADEEGEKVLEAAIKKQEGGEDLINHRNKLRDAGEDVNKLADKLTAEKNADPILKQISAYEQRQRELIRGKETARAKKVKDAKLLKKTRVDATSADESSLSQSRTKLLEEGEASLHKQLIARGLSEEDSTALVAEVKAGLIKDGILTDEMMGGKPVYQGASSLASKQAIQERSTERATGKVEEQKAQMKHKALGLAAVGEMFDATLASRFGKTAAEAFADRIEQDKLSLITAKGVKELQTALKNAVKDGVKVQDVKLENTAAQAAQAQYLSQYFKDLTDLEQKRATDEVDGKFSEERLGFSTPATAYKSLVKRRMDETFQGVEREQAMTMAMGSLGQLFKARANGETLSSDQTAQMMANTQYLVTQAWHDDLLALLVNKMRDLDTGKLKDPKEIEEVENLKNIFVHQLGWGQIKDGKVNLVNRSGADRANDLQRLQASAGDVDTVLSENAVLKSMKHSTQFGDKERGYSASVDHIADQMKAANIVDSNGNIGVDDARLRAFGQTIGVTGKTAINELKSFAKSVIQTSMTAGEDKTAIPASQQFKNTMGQYQEALEIVSDFKRLSMAVGHIDDAGHSFYDSDEKMFRGQLHRDATKFMLGDWNKLDSRKRAATLKTHSITQMDEDNGTASHWDRDAYEVTFAGFTTERLVEQLEDRNQRHLSFRSATEKIRKNEEDGSYIIADAESDLVTKVKLKGQGIDPKTATKEQIVAAQVAAIKDIARSSAIGLKHESAVLVSILGKMTGQKWDESVNKGELNLDVGKGTKYAAKIRSVQDYVTWVNFVRGDKDEYDGDSKNTAYFPEEDDREFFELTVNDISSKTERHGKKTLEVRDGKLVSIAAPTPTSGPTASRGSRKGPGKGPKKGKKRR